MTLEIENQYGKLTVIEETDKRYHQIKIYRCLCDCGNCKEVNTNQLHGGHVTSCGCANHKIKDLTRLKFGRLTESFKERSKFSSGVMVSCICIAL